MTAPAWFSDADVRAAAPIAAVIDAIGRGLEHEAAGSAWNIDKTMTTWPDASSAHALGAIDTVDGLVVFKTWVNTPAGANALVSVFDAADGRLRATLEAATLGMLRTAAVSGLATRLLADPAADELAVIGGGRQALWQVQAVAAVRPLRRVRVWSPTAENREAFAARVRAELGLAAEATATLDEALAGAPVVTTVTRAVEPFLRIEQLADGAHLNAVGAILPRNAELAPGVLEAADLCVTDSLENARRASREFAAFDDWDRVVPLSGVVTGKFSRSSAPRLTVFKAMGMGLSDLAVAGLVVGPRNLVDAP